MAYKAHFIDVGCADCTIFEIGNDLVMVDCGYRRFNNGASRPTSIYNYLKTVIGKTYIDLLIITHPHHDHYWGKLKKVDTKDWVKSIRRCRYEKGWHNFQNLYRQLVGAWVLFNNSGEKPKLLDEGEKE